MVSWFVLPHMRHVLSRQGQMQDMTEPALVCRYLEHREILLSGTAAAVVAVFIGAATARLRAIKCGPALCLTPYVWIGMVHVHLCSALQRQCSS